MTSRLRYTFAVVLCFHGLTTHSVHGQSPDQWIEQHLPELTQAYIWFHQNPEVSFAEKETAAKFSMYLKEAGYDVTTDVGGHGVVGLMRNGDGPTVMLRTDLDALPVKEQTALPFASKKTVEAAGGITTGIMHACGHDVHITNVIGTAQYLASHRDQWHGTLMVIGQPAEERGAGAQAMLDDGLFERFAKPDYAVALHVGSDIAAGTVTVAGGFMLANVDSVDITLKGRGGHGSAPQTTVDPIAMAALLIVDLQTIVSREIAATSPAVVTVGSIHAGSKHNIIPDECHLQLTIRSYDDQTRETLLASIQRKANAISTSFRAEKPEIKIGEGTPALENDDELAGRLAKAFAEAIGTENVLPSEPSMGGEDFSRYGRAGVPILMYRLGAVSQERLDRFKQLGVSPPSLHSATFYPDIDRALPVAMKTMIAAVLELCQLTK
ncbi:MAG: amidohydrolase [Pirellulaceae bacterium]